MSELNQGEVEVPSAELILDLPDWMGTSYSQLQTYRACPQRWYYSYRLGLQRPETDTMAMDFGSWWHLLRACDSIDRGRELESLRYAPEALEIPCEAGMLDTAGDDLQGQFWDVLDQWWEKLDPVLQEGWEEAYSEPVPARLRALNAAWRREYGGSTDEEPLAVEVWWTRPLSVVVGDQVIELRLGGFVDEVYWDNRREMVVIRDHKTHTAALSPRTSADDLTDGQLHLYAWGINPLVGTWGLPAKGVGAVAYDRVRTAKPKTPKLNLDGTLSKSITDYDAHTYTEWVGHGVYFEGRKKNGEGSGMYLPDPELVEALSTEAARSKWFQRTRTPINRNVVRAHLQSAVDTVRDQVNVRARIAVSQEAPRNLGRECKYCPFVELCRVEMLKGPMPPEELAESLEIFGLTPKKPRIKTV